MRAIGCAHFAKYGARLRHDLRNAKSVSNLDQFAAGGDDFVPGRQLPQNKIDRRRIIVDENGVTAHQSLQQQRGMHITLAALASFQIVFEIRITADGTKVVERRTSEVGMQNDAGRVDDRSE